jgi:hypothetical protein
MGERVERLGIRDWGLAINLQRTTIMDNWLDTETKAMLQQAPPEKFAPPKTGKFALVLLKKGHDRTRIIQALTKIPELSTDKSEHLVTQSCPLLVASELSLSEAILGQFELVCADTISVFIKNEIVSSVPRSQLRQICSPFQACEEFENVSVNVTLIPQTDQGKQFVDQFLGGMAHVAYCPHRGYYYEGKVMRKKARIMSYWAEKIGAHAWKFGE